MVVSYEELYQKLAVHGAQTRILHLQPADNFDGDIECNLEIIDLASPDQEYVALSYSWGDEPRDRTVHCSNLEIDVMKSCVDALRALREQHEKLIWIDQLCINQRSLVERGSQVAMMSEIFRLAKGTYVFLGLLDGLMAATNEVFHLDDMAPASAISRLIERAEGAKLRAIEAAQSRLDAFLRHSSDGALVTDAAGLRLLLEEWAVSLSILSSRYVQRCKELRLVLLLI